jgi:antitoxin component of MazEF toxin-antitoxin module
MNIQKSFTITKKIAKYGSQGVIIIPTMLQEHLKAGKLAQITIELRG